MCLSVFRSVSVWEDAQCTLYMVEYTMMAVRHLHKGGEAVVQTGGHGAGHQRLKLHLIPPRHLAAARAGLSRQLL